MRPTSAFSLVELSIVLVILGLLTGGILTGQSLIRAAELRAILTEKDQYISAANTFRTKYLSLPGDLPNATDFWGDTSATNQCKSISTEPAHYRICNGNADGGINNYLNGAGYNERIQFWRHLALAGMIEGSYSGESIMYTTVSSTQTISVMPRYFSETTPLTPSSRAMNMRWYTGWSNGFVIGSDFSQTFSLPANYQNWLLPGISFLDGSYPSFESKMSAAEVWGIDKKIDDGIPNQGKVHGYNMSCLNYTAAGFFPVTYTNTSYKLDDDTEQCGVIFSNVF